MAANKNNKPERVYVYTFANGKRYVGKTAYPDTRCLNYRQYHKSQPVHHALKNAEKEGNKPELEFLSKFETNKVAGGIEKFFIAYYRTNIYRYDREFGYNCTDGGEGISGCKHPPRTDDFKANKSAAMMGNTNNLGKKHRPRTDAYRAKQVAAQLEAQNRSEVKANKSAALKGNTNARGSVRTPKFKAKISVATKGDNNPMSAANIRRRFIAKCFPPV